VVTKGEDTREVAMREVVTKGEATREVAMKEVATREEAVEATIVTQRTRLISHPSNSTAAIINKIMMNLKEEKALPCNGDTAPCPIIP
jgi:hypothetical protein